MNTFFYTDGIKCALAQLGLKVGQHSPTIAAEQFAALLQQQEDDVPVSPRPDNTTASNWNKAVSWGSPKDLTGIDSGMGQVTGMLSPMNPRS